MGNGLAVGNCMQQKMEVKQNSENVDLLKTCFNITFFAYQKTCLGSSSFPSTLPIGFHDSHHFAPDVGPITASIYSIQVLFSPSLLAQYNLRTRNDATGTKEIFTHTVDWNSSINPTAFGGGRLESKVVPPSSQLQPPRNWTNNSRKSSSTEMKFLSAFKSSIAAFTLGSQICQESEASHKRFPFYTRVENHGPVQRHVFKMLSTATVLNDTWPGQTSNKKPSSLLNLCCCENRSLLGVFVRK